MGQAYYSSERVRGVENVQNEQRMTKMESNLENIQELLIDIKNDLKNMNQAYVPRNEINVLFQQRDKEIADIKTNLADGKRNVPNWISSIVAVIAMLIAYFK